ncbi:phage terminase large subunit [Escherichia coli O145:H28]|nr:phage terminase large subunit [Escherichia coli O145:H28]
MTDFRGKTSIFSHPVYLFLRKFSLQDSRGGSDCLVYAYAALRVSVQRWQLDLAVLAKSREEETTRPTLKELAAKLSGGVNGYSR